MLQIQTRVTGYLITVLLAGGLFTLLFAWLMSPYLPADRAQGWLSTLFVFDRLYLDFALVALVGVILANLPFGMWILSYLWFGIFFIAYLLQLSSIYFSGQFITFLAADNINHTSLLLDYKAIIPVTATVGALLMLHWWVGKGKKRSISVKALITVLLALLGLSVIISKNEDWLSDETLMFRQSVYAHKSNFVPHDSPLKSLYQVLVRDTDEPVEFLSGNDISKARTLGMSIASEQHYPLIKDWIYKSPLPFEQLPGKTDKPNVIVFFVEGLAARTLNNYNNHFPGLTPNLVEFEKYGMRVDNYYNHTFATYRGLHGQLCSIYPLFGGIGGWHTNYKNLKNVSYYCLSDILNEQGYSTVFLDSHRADSAYIDEMMEQLNFDRVITAEYISDAYLDGEEPKRSDSLSDNQLLKGLIGLLENEYQDNQDNQPFFLGMYNLGTHAWQNITEDGKRFKGGANFILNTIHNFDYAFGEFWSYFKSSPLYENTIVVFTTDHTHFEDRDYQQLVSFQPDYVPVFVDQIPLIIYDPTRNLPPTYDVEFASSIDFAPTMVQWLGFPNRRNAFLGTSLFDDETLTGKQKGVSLAGGGQQTFVIDKNGVRKQGHQSSEGTADAEQLEYARRLLVALRQLEQHNRIWPVQ